MVTADLGRALRHLTVIVLTVLVTVLSVNSDSRSTRREGTMYIRIEGDHAELTAPDAVHGYPHSDLIKGIRLDLASRRTDGLGSDIWPITWADDDHQYSGFGDGVGFQALDYKEQSGPERVSMGVSRIEGGPDDYVGVNVWGGTNCENPAQFTGKSTGIICVDGVLYKFWCGPESKTVPMTRVAVSRDHSRTWELQEWLWTMYDGIYAGAFINFGKNNAGARDPYVYAVFSRLATTPEEERNWLYEVPGAVDLARAPADRILEKEAWQWFAGTGDSDQATWTSSVEERQPTLRDPEGIKIVSCCHHAGLDRFLLTYSFRDTDGNFAMFEAQNPWGPWKVVAYIESFDTFKPPEPNWRVVTHHFAPKWWRDGGKTFTMVFNVGDDSWNTMHGELILGRP